MKGRIPTASPVYTHRGWVLSTPVVITCTSSGTKAPSRQAPPLSSSFRQVRCVGLTLRARGTARSDEDGRIRRCCEFLCALLHLRKSQLFSFHGIAHSSTKN